MEEDSREYRQKGYYGISAQTPVSLTLAVEWAQIVNIPIQRKVSVS